MGRIAAISSRARSLVNFRGPLLAAWVAAGHEVHAICPGIDEQEPSVQSLRMMGVRVHFVRMNRTGTSIVGDARLWLDLFKVMRQMRPDKVLAYTVKPIVYGLTAAACAGVKDRYALVTGLGHAFIGERRSMLRPVVLGLYRIALQGARRIFFQNRDDRDVFLDFGLVTDPARTMIVNGSGVDLDYFSTAPLSDGTFSFLFIGRLLGAKGVREYAEAAIALRRAHPDVSCKIVGWIDDNPDSIAKSELDAWIAAGIEYVGQLEDVRPALRECTVFVLPSYREGTPRTVLEAMSMGRPVITTDAPGCRETVTDGLNGLLVDVGSVSSLLAAMETMLADPAARAAMALEARRIAEEKYDVRRVTRAMLDGMGLAGAGI